MEAAPGEAVMQQRTLAMENADSVAAKMPQVVPSTL